MREILFRAKDIDNGEWIYGNLIETEELGEDKNIFAIMTKDNHHYTFGEYEMDGWFEVDENTIGQFTGRVDKNGNRIFEGDIVKDTAGGIYKVVYDAEYMRFAFDDGIKWGLEGFESLNDFEVIGNAFDNPKLLEE